MSHYLESSVLTHVLLTNAFPKPSVIAIALCTSVPLASDTGNLSGKEVNGGGYARYTIGPGDAFWSSIVNGIISNSTVITFPVATGNWGIITSIAIVDSDTIGAGNLLFYGNLTSPLTVANGNNLQFNIGQLQIQLT